MAAFKLYAERPRHQHSGENDFDEPPKPKKPKTLLQRLEEGMAKGRSGSKCTSKTDKVQHGLKTKKDIKSGLKKQGDLQSGLKKGGHVQSGLKKQRGSTKWIKKRRMCTKWIKKRSRSTNWIKKWTKTWIKKRRICTKWIKKTKCTKERKITNRIGK